MFSYHDIIQNHPFLTIILIVGMILLSIVIVSGVIILLCPWRYTNNPYVRHCKVCNQEQNYITTFHGGYWSDMYSIHAEKHSQFLKDNPHPKWKIFIYNLSKIATYLTIFS